jgi:hypothetical protein
LHRGGDRRFERGPSVEAMLAREGVLHVAQRGDRRGVLKGSLEARACVGGVCAERGEPALRFLLELSDSAALEARRSWDLPPMRRSPLSTGRRRRTRACRVTAWVGGFPCADGRPSALRRILERSLDRRPSNCFRTGCQTQRGPSSGDHLHHGNTCAFKALLLITAANRALDSASFARSTSDRDCRDRYVVSSLREAALCAMRPARGRPLGSSRKGTKSQRPARRESGIRLPCAPTGAGAKHLADQEVQREASMRANEAPDPRRTDCESASANALWTKERDRRDPGTIGAGISCSKELTRTERRRAVDLDPQANSRRAATVVMQPGDGPENSRIRRSSPQFFHVERKTPQRRTY